MGIPQKDKKAKPQKADEGDEVWDSRRSAATIYGVPGVACSRVGGMRGGGGGRRRSTSQPVPVAARRGRQPDQFDDDRCLHRSQSPPAMAKKFQRSIHMADGGNVTMQNPDGLSMKMTRGGMQLVNNDGSMVIMNGGGMEIVSPEGEKIRMKGSNSVTFESPGITIHKDRRGVIQNSADEQRGGREGVRRGVGRRYDPHLCDGCHEEEGDHHECANNKCNCAEYNKRCQASGTTCFRCEHHHTHTYHAPAQCESRHYNHCCEASPPAPCHTVYHHTPPPPPQPSTHTHSHTTSYYPYQVAPPLPQVLTHTYVSQQNQQVYGYGGNTVHHSGGGGVVHSIGGVPLFLPHR